MTYPSIIDQQPLHLRDMTPDEVFRFGQLCATYAADGRPLPVDPCGYVSDDAVTARIQASTEVASVSA